MRPVEGQREAIFTGLLSIALVLALFMANPGGLAFAARESLFDRYMIAFPRSGPATDIIAIDIDSASLEKLGAWPWQRAQIAALIEKVAHERPRAIAMDILMEGQDRNGSRSVISRIANQEGRSDLLEIAKTFPDDDAAFSAAIDKGIPVVLGLGISERPSAVKYAPLVLAANHDNPIDLAPVRIGGLLGPPLQAADAAAGLGLLSLDTDIDGRLRHIPLLFDVTEKGAGAVYSGFALETVRSAEGASTVGIDSNARQLEIGRYKIATSRDSLLRLYPRKPDFWRAHIVPAWKALEGALTNIGENTIVLIGSSAPEAGAYLPGAVQGAISTLQVQTQSVDQILSGTAPQRILYAPWSEYTLAIVAGIVATTAAIFLSPLFVALAVSVLALACVGLSAAVFLHATILIDILPALATTAFAAATASASVHNRVRANRTLVEARFARYLAPAVVEILARNPQLLRIEAQRREVTALFTDLEGFTSFGERTPPALLIATLNDYFEMIAKIAVEHGGMVDKIVGDAVHVFFNMPLDQPDHAQRAVRCAREIYQATREYQQQDRQIELGFGRTRIGVDTGFATVGDVGGRAKLDYTAHGEAVNRAARLQSLARDVESGVLIGAGTVNSIGSAEGLQSVGKATLRGLSQEQDIYTFA